jgi:hypothetical protein
MSFPRDTALISTSEQEVLVFIGIHSTENYITLVGNWMRFVYHLVRSAYEQRGAEFAQAVVDALLKGNANKKASVRSIAKRAMAGMRVAEAMRQRKYEPPQADLEDDPMDGGD